MIFGIITAASGSVRPHKGDQKTAGGIIVIEKKINISKCALFAADTFDGEIADSVYSKCTGRPWEYDGCYVSSVTVTHY